MAWSRIAARPVPFFHVGTSGGVHVPAVSFRKSSNIVSALIRLEVGFE